VIQVQSDSPFVSFAVLGLVIFFLVPSRYLHLGHYMTASFVTAFVLGSHAYDAYFWASLLAGTVLGGVWLFRKLSNVPAKAAIADSVAGTDEKS
jgi:hypothetical protein